MRKSWEKLRILAGNLGGLFEKESVVQGSLSGLQEAVDADGPAWLTATKAPKAHPDECELKRRFQKIGKKDQPQRAYDL